MAAVDLQGQGYVTCICYINVLINNCVYLLMYFIIMCYRMDDLLISAPMYSPKVDSPEYGRVYVYRNNRVSF